MQGEGMGAADDPRAEALRRLPTTHSLALRLTDAGLPAELIAECLGIEPAALGPLLVVAEAKLAAILREAGPRRDYPGAAANRTLRS